MTLVIGARCKDGIVLIGDRKVLRGTSYDYTDKIQQVLPEVVVGAAGTTAYFDKFKRQILLQAQIAKQNQEDPEQPAFNTIEDFIIVCERLIKFFREEYDLHNKRELEIIIAVHQPSMETGIYIPSLHGIDNIECVDEEVKKYLCIGNGQLVAEPFMRILWNQQMTMKETAVISALIMKIIDEHKLDISVGGEPQIWFFPFKDSHREANKEEIIMINSRVNDCYKKFYKLIKSILVSK